MRTIIQVLKYLAMVALGFCSIFGVLALALKLHIVTHLPDDAHMNGFKNIYIGGGGLVCIFAAILGLGSFFTAGKASGRFLLMPLLLPVLYCAGVLAWASTLPAQVPVPVSLPATDD